jgi:hypothetical protein
MFAALAPRMIDEWFHLHRSVVIASATKQSSAQCKPVLDCFVAHAPRNDVPKHRLNQALRHHIFVLSFPVTSHKPSEALQ